MQPRVTRTNRTSGMEQTLTLLLQTTVHPLTGAPPLETLLARLHKKYLLAIYSDYNNHCFLIFRQAMAYHHDDYIKGR